MDTIAPSLWTKLLPALAVTGLGCGPSGGMKLEDGNDDDTGGDPSETGDGDGDMPSDGVPPALVLATTDKTGNFVLLRFSEPMAEPTNVDPRDFAISWAVTFAYYDYVDGSLVFGNSNYFEPNGYFAYYGTGPLEVMSITRGAMPTDLLLRFQVPIDPVVCSNSAVIIADLEQVSESPEYEAAAALFPHYSPGSVGVRSVQGEPLAEIGPEWIELGEYYSYVYEYGFPRLSPQIPINCIVEP